MGGGERLPSPFEVLEQVVAGLPEGKSGVNGCILYGFCLCEVDITSVLLLKYLRLAGETNKADLSQLITSQIRCKV